MNPIIIAVPGVRGFPPGFAPTSWMITRSYLICGGVGGREGRRKGERKGGGT